MVPWKRWPGSRTDSAYLRTVSALARLARTVLVSLYLYLHCRGSCSQEPRPVTRLARFSHQLNGTARLIPLTLPTDQISGHATLVVLRLHQAIHYELTQAFENRGTRSEISRESLKETLASTNQKYTYSDQKGGVKKWPAFVSWTRSNIQNGQNATATLYEQLNSVRQLPD